MKPIQVLNRDHAGPWILDYRTYLGVPAVTRIS